ncbi:MAG: hypothetical protein B7Y11_01670 [Sphingobacteriia bacterium 24-36-13]|jgi:hypothetical protein|uniref:hypothetical protein n=1 Tax=Chitinophagaceae TaxID=563835 RepID=UPI000BDDCE97|nr:MULTISPECIES: hypothetical protein [Chitinophagaceae]OYZ55353.1 MAG: hypothetical protein B7Y11_01670 [Sphingobacteriia bacterium 24-36-13]RWZ89467.1 MAG: hypothetical protein EO766_04540 [Hydrotalea sp. AMD]HQS22893.1 hypothetical protein [Sediminibacterium sp.]HQS33930.1 hypothetical protein [Sediminibacterium sp.]
MKNVLFVFFAACILMTACSNDNKDLSRDEAMNLIKQETAYPKVVEYDLFCGDPEFAKKVLDAGLETQGLLTVQRTQKLSDVGKPIIQLSGKAEPYLLPTPEKDKSINIQKVKLAEEELKEVTGIKMTEDGKGAVAEYTTTYKNVTPFSALVNTDFQKENIHQATFALYDDGWRLEKKQ